MHQLLLYVAAANLALAVLVFFDHLRGNRRIARLSSVPPQDMAVPPLVSIVVAARNEQQHVEAAMRSLLALDYSPLEIIAVNDRSEDRTGALLDAIASQDSRLRIVHIEQLPPGWLGKNHALHHGAQQALGEFLLFTDADVLMDPNSLHVAVSYLQSHELDHLALSPTIDMPSWLLESFVVAFIVFFSTYVRPWKARDPKSSAHIGIGAFNLVRTSAYLAVGGHQPIAMRPDDDVKLGKLLKQNGFRQDIANGAELISVPWYGSLREAVIGLEKNVFAGVEYRLSLVIVATALMLLTDVWPFLAVWLPLGPARWIYVGVVVALLGVALLAARSIGVKTSTVFGFPVATLLFVYIVWRATLLALCRGGIRWRDTVYSLSDLKRNRI